MKQILQWLRLAKLHELENVNRELTAIREYLEVVDPVGQYSGNFILKPHVGVTVIGGENIVITGNYFHAARVVVRPGASLVRIEHCLFKNSSSPIMPPPVLAKLSPFAYCKNTEE